MLVVALLLATPQAIEALLQSPVPTQIVLAHGSSASEFYAAQILSQHLSAVAPRGEQVRVVDLAASAAGHVNCYVGYLAAVGPGHVSAAKLVELRGPKGRGGDDAFLITQAPQDSGHSIVLAAAPNSSRGTANAAIELLRGACGFQFLGPNATALPQLPLLAMNLTFGVRPDPQFTLRDTTEVEGMIYAAGSLGYSHAERVARANVLDRFSQAVGLNGRFAHAPYTSPYASPVGKQTVGPAFNVAMLSGNVTDGWAHTAFELLSPTGSAIDCGLVGDAAQTKPCPALARAHPDWFACRPNPSVPPWDVPLVAPLEPNFTSVTYPCTAQIAAMEYSSHLCWSLPAVHTALEAGVRRVLARAPASHYVAIDIMDGFAIPCPADMEAVRESGSFAGPAIGAVSAVAAALEADFPNVRLRTIAYHRDGTLLPPTRGRLFIEGLHKNVIVQYCMSYFFNGVGLYHSLNRELLAQLRGYRALVARDGLWVWHYMGNIGFPLAPYPYYSMLADDIGDLHTEEVSGYYAQGAANGGADMSELRSFLIGRKTLDPTANTTELVREFVRGFYGEAAAPHIHKYLRVMSARAMVYIGGNNSDGQKGGRDYSPSSPFYANETVVAAAAAMSDAAQAAAASTGSADYVQRAARSSISINYILLLRWDEYYNWVTATEGKAWPLTTTNKRQFFDTQFAPACHSAVTSTIGVPICPGWVNGPGPSGHHCWKTGNLTDFERYLFPKRTMSLKTDDASDEGLPNGGGGASTRALYYKGKTVINDGKSTNTDNAASNFTLGASTPPTAATKNNDAIEEGSSSRHRSLSSPAPLVCKTQPSRFVAVSWNPTCECTGDEIVRRGGGPCEACYNYSKSKTKPTNYACRVYENIVEFAELHGNIGQPGTCGPAGYEAACNAIDFGTHANISVACAIDPKDPACTRVAPLDLTNPVGTADQPFGEKYLLLNFVQTGQPIMTHPADTLPMVANGTCSAADRFFSGIWWDNGIAAIAAQAELFFPAYKQAGGQLNEINADWEASMWAPGSCPVSDNATAAGLEAASACLACALLKWRAIEADPRFPAALKQLQALGFKLNGTLARTMGVYQCVASNDSALRPGGMADCSQLDGLGDGQVNLIAWNALIQKRETDAWVSAMMPAARKSFPSVRLSLFSFYRWSPKFCVVPDVGEAGTPAILNCKRGQGSSGPDVSAPVYYDYWLTFDCLHPHGPRGGVNAPDRCAAAAGFSNTLQKLSKNPNFTFNFTGLNIAKATVNHFRQIAQASNGTATELAPWLGFKSFFWDYGCPGYGQPHDFPSSPGCPEPDGYWNERVLHYGMTGAARFYYYNVFYECTYGKRSTHEDDDAMSSSLAELDIVIGCGAKERRWIPDQSVGWGSDFILSGMEVGSERRAWRFTPSLPLSPDIPNITNATRWDPKALVCDRNASYLALGPLTVDYDGHLLKACTITFEHGVVLDVFGGPSEVHQNLPPGVPTTSAAPFGVWIIQPISGAPPSVRCMLDQQPFEASWPLRSHLLRGRTSVMS